MAQAQYLSYDIQSRGMQSHSKIVGEISAHVAHFHEMKEPFRIYHGSTNSTRPTKKASFVDTSQLSRVLDVNKHRKTALVEPNVPMDRLVEETLKHGLIPPVVMEFPGITVGGGYAGTSGESSSFRYGFFDRTINFIEMVLGDGQVVICSDDENADLFHGAAGALGSLGVTTLVELQLQEAKTFVKTLYKAVSSVSEAIEGVKEAACDPANDYVDGIIYSRDHAAIITGRLTDVSSHRIQCFSSARDPWFYLHAEVVTRAASTSIEDIPLAEYLFRYDRGGFWVGKSAFDYFKVVPFNSFIRWLCDDFLHTRMMYTALHASDQHFIAQDLALPYEAAEQLIDYTDQVFGIYPLWLCPLRQSPQPTVHPHLEDQEADSESMKPMLNVGLWGWGPQNPEDFVAVNKDLEVRLKELGGMKWLYARTYYSQHVFWSMYDQQWYDSLRRKYNATFLPSVYEKVKKDDRLTDNISTLGDSLVSIWPFSGLWGLWKAIGSRSYLQARASTWRYQTSSKITQ